MLRSSRNALRNRSTMVTKVAMITINTGIRTCFGIMLRTIETMRLEQVSTNTTARPMVSPLMADVVTARVGHIPSSMTSMGFSFQNPFKNSTPTPFSSAAMIPPDTRFYRIFLNFSIFLLIIVTTEREEIVAPVTACISVSLSGAWFFTYPTAGSVLIPRN